jgi:hypothetical protein
MDEFSIYQLLPKDKFDLENTRKVISLGYPTIEPLIAELIIWVQDINWPVAQELAPFLADIGDPIIPFVRDVLSSSDDIWKYSVLNHIVKVAPKSVGIALFSEISRVAIQPTEGEKAEGVQDIAKEILILLATER